MLAGPATNSGLCSPTVAMDTRCQATPFVFPQLKDDAVTLVDVIAPPDFILDSPIGRADGEVMAPSRARRDPVRRVPAGPLWGLVAVTTEPGMMAGSCWEVVALGQKPGGLG